MSLEVIEPSAVLGISDSFSARRYKKVLIIFALLIIPSLAVVCFSWIRSASGPYWVQFDPSYAYLGNSLNIANGHRPFLTEHPGTPVQVFGAGVIRLINLTSNEDAVAKDVLSRSEFYIRQINNGLVVVYLLALVSAGWLAVSGTGNISAGFAVQIAPFLCLPILFNLVGERPDSLLSPCSALMAGLVLFSLKDHSSKARSKMSLLFGIIVALGTAVKFTFAPLGLIPLIILPTWTLRFRYTVVATIAFLLFVFPILTPFLLTKSFGFLYQVAVHTGLHGNGNAGIVQPRQYLDSLISLVFDNGLFFLFIGPGILLLLLSLKIKTFAPKRFRALLGVTVAELASLLMVAKHPAPHYLVPALGLIGVNIFLCFITFYESFLVKYKRLALAAGVLACVGGLFIAYRQLDHLRYWHNTEVASVVSAVKLSTEIRESFPETAIVSYWGGYSPDYALNFAMEWNGRRYSEILNQLYPSSYFYSPWKLEFSNFGGPIYPDRIVGRKGYFVMYGNVLNESFLRYLPSKYLPDGVMLTRVNMGSTDGESLYQGAVYQANIQHK